MNILSLFDGISCGRVALERAGIPVTNYYSSEIDASAIAVANYNYPQDTFNRLGDIRDWKTWESSVDFSSIDLILGGFPCQSWSVAGKQVGDRDARGQLFWDMLDVVKKIREYNPNVLFLFENVKMKKEFEDYITGHLAAALEGTTLYKYLIDSSMFSAQRRKRFYWTNILLDPTLIKNSCTNLSDIVHENVDGLLPSDLSKYLVTAEKSELLLNKEVVRGKISGGSLAPTESMAVGYFRKDSQANRVYMIHGKAVTLCGSAGGGAAKMGQYLFPCITPERLNKTQNGQRFGSSDKAYTLTCQDRHGILKDGYIRKLTPVECERLQTLPDDYTKIGLFPNGERLLSDSQRYKMTGNGWTVDVVSYMLKHSV